MDHDASGNYYIERAGFTATVYQDNDPESPAEGSVVGVIAWDHRRGDYGDMPANWDDWGLTEALVRGTFPDATVIVPLYAYDGQGGTEIDVEDAWTQRVNGFIYATAATVAECIGDDAAEAQVREVLAQEVEVWVQWAQGDVYGVVVHDQSGTEIDSQWGLYGHEFALEEAGRMLDDVPAVALIEQFPGLAGMVIT